MKQELYQASERLIDDASGSAAAKLKAIVKSQLEHALDGERRGLKIYESLRNLNEVIGETVAELPGLSRSCKVKCCKGLLTTFGLGFTPHIQRQAGTNLRLCAHAVDLFLHLTIASVAPFHGIRGGGQ